MDVKNKTILSDRYLIEAGTVKEKFYIFGNPEGKTIKPAIQVELYNSEGTLMWDNYYKNIPLTRKDLIEIDEVFSKYTFEKERDSAKISKWDNGAQENIKLFDVVKGWNIKSIVKNILLDSHQSKEYLARKAYSILF